jgi:cathepsin E
MFSTSALFPIVCLALTVAADPVVVLDNLIRLSFAKQINITSGVQLVKTDQARAAALYALGLSRVSGQVLADTGTSIPAENQAVTYVVNVGVGS